VNIGPVAQLLDLGGGSSGLRAELFCLHRTIGPRGWGWGCRDRMELLMTYKLITATLIAAATLSAPTANAESKTLPSFLVGTGAQALTLEQMESVRGEGIVASWAVNYAVYFVKKALGNSLGHKVGDFLTNSQTPTYSDYRSVFGSTTTSRILSLMPYWLKPRIVQ